MIRVLRVELSETAIADLEAIAAHILNASGSLRITTGFIDRIEDRCQRIGDAPRSGRRRDDLRPGLRTVPFERTAVITYAIEEDRILIVNVFYGGRDFEAFLRGDAED